MSDADDYRYTRFTTGLLFKDLRFRDSGPRPGDPLPEFDLATTEGARISKKEILAERPLMLVFGSYTCPMTASSIPSLKRLHAEFGDRVAMVMLNVREAHPGKHYPQPETIEKKTEHARVLREHYEMPWTVAVDDVDGTLHRAIDTKPNAAYVIDRDGTIAFRSIWARDERSLRGALVSVASGEAPPRRESKAMIGMVTRAAGSVHEVMRRAGPPAERQHLIANPPLETAALVAPLFRPIIRDPDRRGIAAVVTLSALAAAVIGVAIGVAFAL